MTNEDAPHRARPWAEKRWWLLSASVLSIIAAICLASVERLYLLGGFAILVALGMLPFVAESVIHFLSWWRRLGWAGGRQLRETSGAVQS
jgi:hypothetical protein